MSHSGEYSINVLATAALDNRPVSGWTHNFYRYPARFSPTFVSAAIDSYSKPGDLILDPYVGGGTTVIEGMAAGRHVVGNDLNSLAVFVTKVKTTRLSTAEEQALRRWATSEVPTFTYRKSVGSLVELMDGTKTKNLTLVKARYIKKCVALALASAEKLPTKNSRDFVRCAVLRIAQLALDGRKSQTTLSDFRNRLQLITHQMLDSLSWFCTEAERMGGSATVLHGDASDLVRADPFQEGCRRAALVVTSPPYPGVHVLYHRWQVDGRRETPAPYWIAGCDDGQGASFYNFGDRRDTATEKYFLNALRTLSAIRKTLLDGGHVVQMVAFNRPDLQLPRYLLTMEQAGFEEVAVEGGSLTTPDRRIWRKVPNRKWHANLNGKSHSSNEVVLVHRAI